MTTSFKAFTYGFGGIRSSNIGKRTAFYTDDSSYICEVNTNETITIMQIANTGCIMKDIVFSKVVDKTLWDADGYHYALDTIIFVGIK